LLIIVLFGIGVGLFFELKLLRLMRVVEYFDDELVRFLLKLESLFNLLSLLFVLLLLDLESYPVFLPKLYFDNFLFFLSIWNCELGVGVLFFI
jgi:hypothetical protein